jgi:hypothetical protein
LILDWNYFNFMKTPLLIILFIISLTSCDGSKSKSKGTNSSDNILLDSPTVNKDSLIFELTNQIMASIKVKDFKKFSEFIHPISGVRFSPYSFIDTSANVKLTTVTLIEQINKQTKLVWGSFDGSGDIIQLTIEEYFNRFVYNADFINAEKKSINKMIGRGNTINNLESIYNGCDYTESYFSGFDKKFEGMDWCCLRLVFKKYNDKYYLVGIVHDQWTI